MQLKWTARQSFKRTKKSGQTCCINKKVFLSTSCFEPTKRPVGLSGGHEIFDHLENGICLSSKKVLTEKTPLSSWSIRQMVQLITRPLGEKKQTIGDNNRPRLIDVLWRSSESEEHGNRLVNKTMEKYKFQLVSKCSDRESGLSGESGDWALNERSASATEGREKPEPSTQRERTKKEAREPTEIKRVSQWTLLLPAIRLASNTWDLKLRS